MAGSVSPDHLVKGDLVSILPDDLVRDNIISRLPWYKRPVLRVVSKARKSELDSIDERLAALTREAQPLQCRVAVEYLYYRHRDQTPGFSYTIRIFDGQWRNAPSNGEEWTSSNNQRVIGVTDGTLYSVRTRMGESSRISALDVQSGEWQWRTVFAEDNTDWYINSICRQLRTAGGFFLYRTPIDQNANDQIFHVNSQGQLEQVTDVRVPINIINHQFRIDPRIGFQQLQDRLYVFGIREDLHAHQRIGICYYDLTLQTWNDDELYTLETWFSEFGPNYNDLSVMPNVLCLVHVHPRLYIMRYSRSTRRWVIVGSIEARVLRNMPYWSWSIKCGHRDEKQLCIYACCREDDQDFRVLDIDRDEHIRVLKWLVTERAVYQIRGDRKVWDDDMLGHQQVEYQLVREPRFPQPCRRPRGTLQRGECYGFIRKTVTE